MGAVASSVAAVVNDVGTAIMGLLSAFRNSSASENPVMEAIEENASKIEEAERARRDAEVDAVAAREQQAQAQQLVTQAEIKANEAIAAKSKAEEDMKRMKEEAAAQEQEAITRQAKEDTATKALKDAEIKSQEDAEKVKMAQEDVYKMKVAQMEAENKMDIIKREVETAKADAENAKALQATLERSAEEAKNAAKEAKAAKEKAEKDLKDGIQPVEWPTRRELNHAKKAHRYEEGLFHFAIAGISGSGKSSLINAFRGIANKDPRAARTGIVETTASVARYPDPNPRNPFVWYDVPGAGTLNIPDWRYFNEQGLYVFDCIIVLLDNRFTATDVAILKNCKRFNIPSYIVRSKSNQHIQNVLNDMDMEHDSDGEDDEVSKHQKCAELLPRARTLFIKETRKNVKVNLEKAELTQQRAYLVSKDAMLAVVKGSKVPKGFIDEYDLLRDILSEAKERRLVGEC